MKRFDAIWEFSGGTYTDYTQILGEGSSSLTLSSGESLYFGIEDWLSGILTFLSNPPAPSPVYILEQFDGDEWRSLPLEESLVNLETGIQLQRGSLYWGSSPFNWEKLAFNTTTPESGTPPDTRSRYWVRLRVTSGSITIDRCLPQMYNTYCTIDEVSNFLGVQFDDISPPNKTTVRKMIRANEDWLDNYTRRSFRPRIIYNETHNFNPYGVRLRRYPPWFIVSIALWNGGDYEAFTEGRGQDYYYDAATGMVRFTLPSFRLRNYSFLLSRHIRQPSGLLVTYASGEDFDVSRFGVDVKSIIWKKTAADLVNQADWTGIFTSGLDTVPKPEKMRQWGEEAQAQAEELRMPLIS